MQLFDEKIKEIVCQIPNFSKSSDKNVRLAGVVTVGKFYERGEERWIS